MSTNEELIARLRKGDGNGCKTANELMSEAADALEVSVRENADRKQSEGELVDMVNSLADERDALARTIERIKIARSNHPECELYTGDDAVSCGWKSAVLDIDAALNKGDNNG